MKVSLIAEGGRLRGAYAAGVMTALAFHFGLKRVDFAVATSASTGSLSYYVSGQIHCGKEIWVNYVSSPQFLSFKRIPSVFNLGKGEPLFGVDFLIDDVFKRFFPLDVEALKNSETLMIIPVVNAKTGKVKYFTNKDNVDFFEVLRASKALPILYNKPVEINGELYWDGVMGDPLPIRLPVIVDSRKLIILTIPKGEKIYQKLFTRVFKSRLNDAIYRIMMSYEGRRRKIMDHIDSLEESGDIVIRPTMKLPSMDNRPKTIERLFDQGFKDAVSNKKLENFIDYLQSSENSNFYFD